MCAVNAETFGFSDMHVAHFFEEQAYLQLMKESDLQQQKKLPNVNTPVEKIRTGIMNWNYVPCTVKIVGFGEHVGF